MKPLDCPPDDDIREILLAALPHCDCESTVSRIASALTTNEALPSPTGYPANAYPNSITYWAYALYYWRWESRDRDALFQVRFPYTNLAMHLSKLPLSHETP